MAARPLPSPTVPLTDSTGRMNPAWYEYFKSRDLPSLLTNAANDAAAEAAGVPLYGLYRTGNAVQQRLV